MRTYSRIWQPISLFLAFWLCWLLAGCGGAPPTPTALLVTATASATAPRPTATVDLALAVTSSPTALPSPTASATPTLTPSPTATASPSPTPTQTPTPSPSPEPHVLLAEGRHHQANGDYERAIAAYLALLADAPGPDQAREAQYRLAESHWLARDYVAAAAAWETFLTRYPGDGRGAPAHLMAGRAYQGLNDCAPALGHYQAALDVDETLADLVYDWMGDCHALQVDLAAAATAYRQAIAATADRAHQVELLEKIAGLHLAAEDYAAAVAEYDAILDIARQGWYRAKIEYLAGQALAAAGETQAAFERYRRAMEGDPQAEYAYLALVELVDAGLEVDEFQRGLIDYHAGAAYPDAYGAAIRAFSRYLAAEPAEQAEQAEQALLYKALAQRALDDPEAALETLETIIVDYPDSERLPQVWLAKARTFVWMGDNDRAVRTYQNLASFFPAAEQAPLALWRAARLREAEGSHVEAAQLFQELQAAFPGFKDADEALWRAGLAHYRAGDANQAIVHWQALVDKYPGSPYRPKTLYWLGKVGAEGDHWQQLVAEDAGAYYALRVQQVRSGQALDASRLMTAAVEPPEWDVGQAQAEVEDWLRGWTQVPTATDLATLPLTLTRRLDFQRGQALLVANLRREALAAFDGARSAAWQEPVWLAQLAFYFHDRGLFGLAARCASRLAGLWPEGASHEAPHPVQQLAYPLAYADLISAEASDHDLDPLLLAALIRQESLFEPVAESYAGARGLGQVMPATGEGIARSLKVEGFVLDDLYRPVISVRFAAFYLAVQMGRFDDRLLVALAAYNGGPGNTLRWLEASGDGPDFDLDLFVEVITATQSRLYLQRVYEQYLDYERLYRNDVPSQ